MARQSQGRKSNPNPAFSIPTTTPNVAAAIAAPPPPPPRCRRPRLRYLSTSAAVQPIVRRPQLRLRGDPVRQVLRRRLERLRWGGAMRRPRRLLPRPRPVRRQERSDECEMP